MVAETAERLEVWKVALLVDSSVNSKAVRKAVSTEYSTAAQMVASTAYSTAV